MRPLALSLSHSSVTRQQSSQQYIARHNSQQPRATDSRHVFSENKKRYKALSRLDIRLRSLPNAIIASANDQMVSITRSMQFDRIALSTCRAFEGLKKKWPRNSRITNKIVLHRRRFTTIKIIIIIFFFGTKNSISLPDFQAKLTWSRKSWLILKPVTKLSQNPDEKT